MILLEHYGVVESIIESCIGTIIDRFRNSLQCNIVIYAQ